MKKYIKEPKDTEVSNEPSVITIEDAKRFSDAIAIYKKECRPSSDTLPMLVEKMYNYLKKLSSTKKH